MKALEIIIIVVIAVWVAVAIAYIVYAKKKGKCLGCSGNCACCGKANSCAKNKGKGD